VAILGTILAKFGAQFEAYLTPFCGHWRPFCGGHLVTQSGHRRPFWGYLRPFRRHFGTVLGPFWGHFGAHSGEAILEAVRTFWVHFETHLGHILRHIWAHLVPFCATKRPQMSPNVPPAPPQLRIIPERSGPALALTCHAWGFSPAEVTLRWLRNGIVVGDPSGQSRALPVGDGTFWAQATIEVPPGTGDTFACSALHPSLEEPLSVTWAPGLSPNLSLLVGLAVLTLLLGLFLFIFGLCRYLGPGGALGRAGDTQGTPGGHPRDPRP
uniref:Ig-like domain-containing protein n=1 Tax=Cyanoderma ruficeps TaxID=181631 RepID=A0A8C3P101_9PASS